jgi:ATP-dependent Lon protease
MPDVSPEYGIIRTYLDWLTACRGRSSTPMRSTSRRRAASWMPTTTACPDQRRILEYLAVRKLNGGPQPDLLRRLRGRQDLARPEHRQCRPQVRAAELGGVHDEAEIGTPAHLYRCAAQHHPVDPQGRDPQPRDDARRVMLGGGAFHGDPSSALLEVLDPSELDLPRQFISASPSISPR